MRYDTCTTEQLERFAKDRKLTIPDSTTCPKTRFSIIAHLKRADASPTFAKFTDLPPELRARVYSHNFMLYDRSDLMRKETCTPPPLTLANRLLRSEALPQWYAEHRFVIRLESDQSWQASNGPAWHFFNLTAASRIAMVKKVEFIVWSARGCLVWEVDFPVGEKRGTCVRDVRRYLSGALRPTGFSEEEASRLDSALAARLGVMQARESPKLLRQDVVEMTRILTGR